MPEGNKSSRPDLSVKIGPLRMKNPVTVASGTYGYGTEYAPFHDPGALGAIFLKGLTLEPRPGNAPPRQGARTARIDRDNQNRRIIL